MYLYPDIHLLVFVKAPEKNKIKTRLQPVYSPDFSLAVHTALIDYSLNQWSDASICPINLWVGGDINMFKNQLPQWRNIPHYHQQGPGLGERMAYAAAQMLAESRGGVILVGGDCPSIDQTYLSSACEALKSYDVVIGPAKDGGYVLLGIKQMYSHLFEGIDWGTSSVYQQTLDAVKAHQLTYFSLPVLSDIDRPEDIERLYKIDYFKRLFED